MKTATISSFAAAVLIVAAATGPRSAVAFPEPQIVSPSWMLDFEFEDPRPIAIRAIDGSVKWFWYMPYALVNDTGEDRMFIPEITVATDSGLIINAAQDVPPSVFDQIKHEMKGTLVESPIEVVGKILQGEDYAREGVAIWPAFAEDVDQFTVFFAGHSGENASVRNPVTGEKVQMRRTMMIRYSTPGNLPNPEGQPVVREQVTEVMR